MNVIVRADSIRDFLACAYFDGMRDEAPGGMEFSVDAAYTALEDAGKLDLAAKAANGDEDAAAYVSLWLCDPENGAYVRQDDA